MYIYNICAHTRILVPLVFIAERLRESLRDLSRAAPKASKQPGALGLGFIKFINQDKELNKM